MAKRRRKRRRLKRGVYVFLLFFALFVTSCTMLVRRLTYEEPYVPVELTPIERAMHAYNWDYLTTDGNYASYEDESYTSRQGIDVSAHQEEIDWQRVKDAGIEFAIIRTGYRGTESGRCTEDVWFRTNVEGAAAAGIETGVYFFSQAVSEEEAVEEADFVLDQIKDYDVDGPVVFDMEHPEIGTDRILNVPREEKTRIAKAFLSRVQKAGYKAMLYNSTGLFDEFFEMDMLGEFPLWAAEYGSLPHYSYMFEIWQYTNRGRVDGITGNVDMDIQFIPK